MRKIAARILFLGLAGLLVLAAPAAQDVPAGEPHPTGLLPLDAVQLEGILANFPRVTRVGLNPLGYERANAARAARGLPALDPALVRPLGSEVEAAPAGVVPAAEAAAATIAATGDLPVSVDNSLLRFFPPIRNQGSLGSCASFASTYVQLSYMTAFQRNLDIRDPTDNTNKYSPKWSYGMLDDGENNGTSLYENYILLLRHGAATWAEFPYDSDYRAWCLDAATWRHALSVRTKAVQHVQSVQSDAGLALAKELLADGYVVVFGTYVNSWVFKAAGDDPSTADDDAAAGKQVAYYLNGVEGSHAMTIVGYNDAVWTDINGNGAIDAGERGAFRIANTWGTGWRESGFTWLAYDALKSVSAVSGGPSTGRIPAIQGDLLYVLTARDDYAPLMIGEFTVSHLKRNQLRLTLGRSGTAATSPSSTWPPLAFQNQGGAYAFDGSTTEIAATFVLDFSDLLVQGAGAQRYYLGVNDNQSGSPATLSAFKIVDLTTDPETEAASSLVPQTIDSGQGYAYVDYVYAGPAVNDPPTLSSPQVSPASGDSGDTFTFSVRYSDPDGDAPSVKNLILDETPRTMSLMAGQQAADGWYTFSVTLYAGEHSYAFYFEDGHGESAWAPLAGTTSGPAVYGHVVTSLSPSSAGTGDPGFTLTVTGDRFEDGAVVTWDGADRSTTFVSAGRLDALIADGDIALGRSVPVAVRNPGGLLSNSLSFAVNNPAPSATSLVPAAATGGGSGLTVSVHGTGFVPNSTVRWNGSARTTTYVSATELLAALTTNDLLTGGDFVVSVANPAPEGGNSGGLTFSVSDYNLTVSPQDLDVTAGQSSSTTVRIAPDHGSFDGPVALSCTGLPDGCTASFSPQTVTPGAAVVTSALTLKTTGGGGAGAASAAGTSGLVPPALGLALLLAVLGSARFGRAAARLARARRRLAVAGLILIMVWIAGCSPGGGDPGTQGTPSGTYYLTIHAKSGTLDALTQLTLVVN